MELARVSNKVTDSRTIMKVISCSLALFLAAATIATPDTDSTPECDADPETGPCKGGFKMFFFNGTSNKCQTFQYGGCLGNANRFFTEEDCMTACARRASKEQTRGNIPIIPVIEPKDCKQFPDSGPCKGHFVRYFYNTLNGHCDSFIYGGCLGNENRYKTSHECEKQCETDPIVALAAPIVVEKSFIPRAGFEHCFLPPLEGNCKANIKRYFYRPEDKECHPFGHGGCEGNANNFESVTHCLKACANSETTKPKLMGTTLLSSTLADKNGRNN